MLGLSVCYLLSRVQLCDPMDCSPPGSFVHGVLQARMWEWVVIPFSRDLPTPGTELGSSALQADSLLSEPEMSGLKSYDQLRLAQGLGNQKH